MQNQNQAVESSKIQPHMPIVCSQNVPFAKVDHIEGSNSIKLAKDGSGQHHYIPMSWVKSVDDKGIHIDRTGKQAMQEWSTTPST